MRTIDAQELRNLISMPEAIEAVREAFIASAQGEFSAVPRSAVPSHTLFVMPSERIRKSDGKALGQSVKVISYHEKNAAAGRPVVQGVVLWFDGETGEERFAINGAEVTALRTGAAAGVATEFFAPRNVRTLAVIGTGAIAPDLIAAVCAVRKIETIAVAGRDFRKTQAFAQTLTRIYPETKIAPYENAAAAVREADVICTGTTAREPLFHLADLKPTVHINAMGSFQPQMCELGPDIVAAAAYLCVDDLAALEDCGDLAGPLHMQQIMPENIAGIGDALSQPHSNTGGISIFKSIGIAAQDWAIASRIARASA